MGILTILKTALSNPTIRNILVGVFLAIALAVSWNLIKSHYYNTGYEAGEAYQLNVQQKEQDKLKKEYLEELRVKDEERNKLNQEIVDLKQSYSDLQQKRKVKEDQLEERISAYEKYNTNNTMCLDPQWVQLYKDSLPE